MYTKTKGDLITLIFMNKTFDLKFIKNNVFFSVFLVKFLYLLLFLKRFSDASNDFIVYVVKKKKKEKNPKIMILFNRKRAIENVVMEC